MKLLITKAAIVICSLFLLGTSNSTPPIQANPKGMESLWQEVDNLEKDGLPRSALVKAEQIFDLAKESDDLAHLIRSIIYRLKYTTILEEDGFEKAIQTLEEEMDELEGASLHYMHFLLAKMYNDYYKENSFSINQRSVVHGQEPGDIKTWDKTRFQYKVVKNLLIANSPSYLTKASIGQLEEIVKPVGRSNLFFPTLFEVVAYNSIEVLKEKERHWYYFDSDNESDYLYNYRMLDDAGSFVGLDIEGDTLSYNHTAAKIYQNWLRHRLADSDNVDALVFVDIQRLKFVESNMVGADNKEIMVSRIEEMLERFKEYPASAELVYEIASHHYNMGESYDFSNPLTHQFEDSKLKAHSLLENVLEKFPDAFFAPNCQNLKQQIENRSFNFQSEKLLFPNQKNPLRINYKNIDKLHNSIIKIDYKQFQVLKDRRLGRDDFLKQLAEIGKTVVENKLVELPNDGKYNMHSTELLLDELDYGFYVLVFNYHPTLEVEENSISVSEVFVSDLFFTNKSSQEKPVYQILNRATGKPVEGANVKVFADTWDYQARRSRQKKIFDATTEEDGLVKLDWWNSSRGHNFVVEVSKGNDFITEHSNYYGLHSWSQKADKVSVRIFTDRAIYRPGQTIHFKLIAYHDNGEKSFLTTDFSFDVELKDVNWQSVEAIRAKTNEFGSFSGSFSIPLDVLPGRFNITSNYGSHTVRVEEYKRPNFEVAMQPVEGEFRLNDSVTFEGNAIAYSGAPLTDAKITYTISRMQNWWGRWSFWAPRTSAEEIAFGTTTLDDKGNFKIPFKATAPGKSNLENSFFTYTIKVDVTDINGETQSGSSSVSVSNQSLKLSSNITEVVDREEARSVSISSKNISGRHVDAEVRVEVYLLKDPAMLLAPKKWMPTDKKLYTHQEWYKKYPGQEYDNELDKSTWRNHRLVLNQTVNTKDASEVEFKAIKSWQPGSYRIILRSTDKWGNAIEEIKEFTLFSSLSKKMPHVDNSFFLVSANSAQPGETVSVFVGSSHQDVTLFYDLAVKGKVEKQETLKLSNEVRKIDIPILEKHRGGISINLMFIKNGQMHTFKKTIGVEWLNKQLSLKFTTFRDKTLPGSHEEWRVKIANFENNPAEAELLAGMYDASLDLFAANAWSFSYLPRYWAVLDWSALGLGVTGSSEYTRLFNPVSLSIDSRIPSINFFGFQYGSRFYKNRRFSTTTALPVAEALEGMAQGIVVVEDDVSFMLEEEALSEVVTVAYSMAADHAGQGDPPYESFDSIAPPPLPPQIRSNFEETAFFYPHLVTDENGEVLISFTVPESLTRWNFLGLAHTKDMKFGTLTANLVTQKELMVTPNMPRFFRESDEMEINARISNISDEDIAGKATIEFFDPVSLSALNSLFMEEGGNIVDFEVGNGANVSVNWKIKIPEGLSLVGVRIVATGKDHSDGEERVIPILTNRILVTETMPLPVRKSGATNFSMGRLIDSESSTTLRHHSVTLEFTSNPAWYAVQALPYLMEFPYECAEQIFSRLYANILASHVANSNPKVKRVFDAWKNTPDSKALISNLEKNQELKALLIEETPWVLQAKDESERKRRMGLLFDLNKMGQEKNKAMRQLADMQKHNGGWPWFSGMPESWYITQHIVAGFGKLAKLEAMPDNDEQLTDMMHKAISFIDGELVDSYNRLNGHCDDKCMKNDQLGYLQVHYLYTRSFFSGEYPIPESASVAFYYYLGQAEKYWRNKGFYVQGMLAVALNRFERSTEANKIIASLREHARHHHELGVYWNIGNGFFWHQAPIETHAMLMEAFEEVAKDQNMVDDMKVWLLKQKQTQDWKTTKATTEAIYALLMRGTDILSDDDVAIIKLGDITIDPKSDPEIRTEAGTGYFKKSWHGADVKPSMGNVSVTKKTDQVSWGAVYWQYFEHLDKITHFEETPLKIDKKLFVERRAGDKKVIVPLEKDSEVTVGDRIKVRIELRVDRDMEYVHLKDMRASSFEPVETLSGYRWSHGLGYYQAIKDASMNFFINYLQKGTYVFEYDLIASQRGNFSNGITTIQCMYAPEFTSHSEGVRVIVE